MKARDIKRLERVAEHYEKIVNLLSDTYDSVDDSPTEYLYPGSITALKLVKDMLDEAIVQKNWVKAKAKQLKDNNL